MLNFIGEVVISGSFLFLGPGQACWAETIQEYEGMVVTTEIKCIPMPPHSELKMCMKPFTKKVKSRKRTKVGI